MYNFEVKFVKDTLKFKTHNPSWFDIKSDFSFLEIKYFILAYFKI